MLLIKKLKFIVCCHFGLIYIETWPSKYCGIYIGINCHTNYGWTEVMLFFLTFQTCMMTTPHQPLQPKASCIKLPARGRR